jgi:hypothetical protein
MNSPGHKVISDDLTIRPTTEMLVSSDGTEFPTPVFVVGTGLKTRPVKIEIEITPGEDSGAASATWWFDTGLWLGKGESAEWHMPASAWGQLTVYPRLFYRAVGKSRSGDIVCSSGTTASGDLPFLHGRPSASFYRSAIPILPLPSLRVVGNMLFTEDGTSRVLLRGVNVSGLNHARYFYGSDGTCSEREIQICRSRRWREAACVTPGLFDRLKTMEVNIVRIPLNQDWALMGYHQAELPEFKQSALSDYIRYLEDVDQIIAWAAERGMYVMLSLHTLRLSAPQASEVDEGTAPGTGGFQRRLQIDASRQPYNAHMPDQRSWLFWSVLAHRYRNCPAVLFDLCNEPHEVHPLYWDGAEYRGALPPKYSRMVPSHRRQHRDWWVAEWHRWAESLEELVHRINPDALVFISGFGGPCWSSSLEQMNIRTYHDNRNVVLAVHWYWSGALGPETWRRFLGLERPLRYPQESSGASGGFPLFVKEWGLETPQSITGESALDPPSVEYRNHWSSRRMPEYSAMIHWGKTLSEFFTTLADTGPQGTSSGLVGFTAWSTGDKPRIFERERVYSGPYKEGFPLTDYGWIVEEAITRLAGLEKGEGTTEVV